MVEVSHVGVIQVEQLQIVMRGALGTVKKIKWETHLAPVSSQTASRKWLGLFLLELQGPLASQLGLLE